MNLQSLQVTAPLTRNEGLAAIVKRLARVARFYALAAMIGAAAVLLLVLAFPLVPKSVIGTSYGRLADYAVCVTLVYYTASGIRLSYALMMREFKRKPSEYSASADIRDIRKLSECPASTDIHDISHDFKGRQSHTAPETPHQFPKP